MLCKSSDVRKKVDQNEYNYNAACSSCIILVYVHNELKKWSQLSVESERKSKARMKIGKCSKELKGEQHDATGLVKRQL